MEYDLAAEQSAIGALLIDPESNMVVAVDLLKPEDFYREDHGRIYRAMIDLHESDRTIDVVTLCSHLEKGSDEGSEDPALYLTQLIRLCPTSTHFTHYARLVVESATKRRVLASLGEIKGMIEEGYEVSQVLEQAHDLLSGISERVETEQIVIPFQQALAQYWESIEREGEGIYTRVPFGFTAVDRLVGGLGPGDLCYLAGRSSVGKTTFALQMVWNLAKLGIWPVVMFSVESTEQELAGRLLGYVTNVFSDAIRKGAVPTDRLVWVKKASEMADIKFLVREVHDLTPRSLDAFLSVITRQHDVKLAILDYFHRMRAGGSAVSRLDEERIISGQLKSLAVKYQIPLLAVSQIRKREVKEDAPPSLDDLMGSAALGYDADVVVMMDWPGQQSIDHPKRNVVRANVVKNRNGPTGVAWLMRGGQGQLADLRVIRPEPGL